MNWRLAIAFSPIGVLMGAVITSGLDNPWIILLWTFFGLLSAYVIGKYETVKWWLNAIVIGVIWGILQNLVVSLFFDSYLTNNSGYVRPLNGPEAFPTRYWVLLIAPATGIGTGLLILLFALLLKWINKNRWAQKV